MGTPGGTLVETTDAAILLVDDDEDDAQIALKAFRELGLEKRVRLARDGVEALEYLHGSRSRGGAPAPLLVLLDMSMPKIGGLEVLKAIRADPRTRNVPVVMLTTSSRPEDVERSYALGANGYIVKPSDFERYTAAVAGAGSYWLTWNTPAEPAHAGIVK